MGISVYNGTLRGSATLRWQTHAKIRKIEIWTMASSDTPIERGQVAGQSQEI